MLCSVPVTLADTMHNNGVSAQQLQHAVVCGFFHRREQSTVSLTTRVIVFVLPKLLPVTTYTQVHTGIR